MNQPIAYIGLDVETTGLWPFAHDVEATGLWPFTCENNDTPIFAPQPANYLLEIGLIAYDAEFNELGHIVRLTNDAMTHKHVEELAHKGAIDDYVEAMHTDNGLWHEFFVLPFMAHTLPPTIAAIEDELIAWLEHFTDVDSDNTIQPIVVGSSITLDRVFLQTFMPRLHGKLHYRSIDATSLKEALVAPGIIAPDTLADIPDSDHRVLGDIRRSVATIQAIQHAVGDTTSIPNRPRDTTQLDNVISETLFDLLDHNVVSTYTVYAPYYVTCWYVTNDEEFTIAKQDDDSYLIRFDAVDERIVVPKSAYPRDTRDALVNTITEHATTDNA